MAAGLVPIASASDGGGSIRIPAACCGLFGLKPQRGRVSLAPDLEHWHGLPANGCVSRTVLDTALWLDVVSGGSAEPGAPPPPERPFVESAQTPPGKLRVAWSTAAPRALAPPTVSEVAKGAVADAAETLRSLGHEVEPARPGLGHRSATTSSPRYLRGVAEDVDEVPQPRAARTPDARLRPPRPADPRQALRAGARAAARPTPPASTRSSTSFDVLMMPVMGGTALPVRRWEGRGALGRCSG